MSTFAIRLRFLSFAGGAVALATALSLPAVASTHASTPPAPAGVMTLSKPQSITPPLTM